MMLDKGKLVEAGTPAEIFDAPQDRASAGVRRQDPAALRAAQPSAEMAREVDARPAP